MFKWSKSDALVLPIALAVIIVSAVVMRLILRNKSEFYRSLPLKFLAALIVALEIGKQLEYIIWLSYSVYVLPMHFCSTFIWLMPLAQFTKGKVKDFFKPMPLFYSFLVFVLMYVYPHVLLGDATSYLFDNFSASHSFLYHHTIVAYLIFSIALGDYKPRKKDWISLVAGVAFYTTYAVPVAYTLKSNYVNILYSSFPPFEALRQSLVKINYVFGQVVYDFILFAVAVLAIVFVWYIYCVIYNCVHRSKAKNEVRISGAEVE